MQVYLSTMQFKAPILIIQSIGNSKNPKISGNIPIPVLTLPTMQLNAQITRLRNACNVNIYYDYHDDIVCKDK